MLKFFLCLLAMSSLIAMDSITDMKAPTPDNDNFLLQMFGALALQKTKLLELMEKIQLHGGGLPLHWAAGKGELEAAKFILDQKIDKEAIDRGTEASPLGSIKRAHRAC